MKRFIVATDTMLSVSVVERLCSWWFSVTVWERWAQWRFQWPYSPPRSITFRQTKNTRIPPPETPLTRSQRPGGYQKSISRPGLKASTGGSRRFSHSIAIFQGFLFICIFHVFIFLHNHHQISFFFLQLFFSLSLLHTTTITTHPIMTDSKKNLLDASGTEPSRDDETATAILRRKKKDNGMYFF